MNMQLSHDKAAILPELDALVAKYGVIRVIGALGALLFRSRARHARHLESDLSDRLRRDIGLDALPPRRDYWML